MQLLTQTFFRSLFSRFSFRIRRAQFLNLNLFLCFDFSFLSFSSCSLLLWQPSHEFSTSSVLLHVVVSKNISGSDEAIFSLSASFTTELSFSFCELSVSMSIHLLFLDCVVSSWGSISFFKIDTTVDGAVLGACCFEVLAVLF